MACFFILQIAVALAYASDNLVAAKVLGPEAVTQYSVPAKMFSLLSVMVGILLNPLWPAYGEAIARGDISWVKRTLIRSLSIALLFSILTSALFVAFGVQIIHVWVGPEFNPSLLLRLGLAAWTVMASVGGAAAIFMNGVNVIKFQVLVAGLVGIGGLLFKVLLAQQIGIAGIIWGTVIAYAVFSVVPSIVFIPKLLVAMQQQVKKTKTA